MTSRTMVYKTQSLLFLSLVPLTAALPEAIIKPTAVPSPAEQDVVPNAQVTPFVVPPTIVDELKRRAVSPTLVQLDGYSYLGCYEDGGEPLSVTYKYDNGMSPEFCRNICSLADCPMFGVQNAFECHCGTTLEPFVVSAAESECDRDCRGDGRELCGGVKRLNVYSATAGFDNLGAGGSDSSPTGAGDGGDGDVSDPGANEAGAGAQTGGGASPTGTSGSGDAGASNNGGGSGSDSDDKNGAGTSDNQKDGVTLSVGAIAGIAIGSAAVVAIIGGVIACVFCLRKRKDKHAPAMVQPTGYQPPPPAMSQQGHMQYNNTPPPQAQYGYSKPMESSPSYSTVSPAGTEPVNRSVSPLVAGTAAPPAATGNGAHEMSAPMAYEMPGSGYQK